MAKDKRHLFEEYDEEGNLVEMEEENFRNISLKVEEVLRGDNLSKNKKMIFVII